MRFFRRYQYYSSPHIRRCRLQQVFRTGLRSSADIPNTAKTMPIYTRRDSYSGNLLICLDRPLSLALISPYKGRPAIVYNLNLPDRLRYVCMRINAKIQAYACILYIYLYISIHVNGINISVCVSLSRWAGANEKLELAEREVSRPNRLCGSRGGLPLRRRRTCMQSHAVMSIHKLLERFHLRVALQVYTIHTKTHRPPPPPAVFNGGLEALCTATLAYMHAHVCILYVAFPYSGLQ